eukprot:TRINITY_DN61971_c0_g1_i1.p1 TRINITY_DN61971_c0_g1~~TRINITY_DN61971_c0_g1_i1.p1  ORF type:complete len:499 (-),score=87.93 TRINITY_DN61971_c0_g1_i1:139-1635(-)
MGRGSASQEKSFRKEAGLITKVVPKIRWFCGLCHMQFRSQVGFNKHCAHPEHLRRELVAIERVRNHQIKEYCVDEFSKKFEVAFCKYVHDLAPQLLEAHEVYRTLVPNDRAMKRLQETCWGTLGRFCAYLREHGALKAFKTDHGWRVQVPQEMLADGSDDDAGEGAREAPARPIRTRWDAVAGARSLWPAASRRRVDDADGGAAAATAAAKAVAGNLKRDEDCRVQAAGCSEENTSTARSNRTPVAFTIGCNHASRRRTAATSTSSDLNASGIVVDGICARSGNVATATTASVPAAGVFATAALSSPAAVVVEDTTTSGTFGGNGHERPDSSACGARTWVRAGLVVKVLTLSRCKAVVEALVDGGRARVRPLTLPAATRAAASGTAVTTAMSTTAAPTTAISISTPHDGESSSPTVTFEVDVKKLETVIPALGREVLLCGAPGIPHDGALGILIAVHEERFCVDVRLRGVDGTDGALVTGVPYEGVCKIHDRGVFEKV